MGLRVNLKPRELEGDFSSSDSPPRGAETEKRLLLTLCQKPAGSGREPAFFIDMEKSITGNFPLVAVEGHEASR